MLKIATFYISKVCSIALVRNNMNNKNIDAHLSYVTSTCM